MLILLILFPLLTIPSNIDASVTGDVYKYAKEFSTLSTPTLDWLNHIGLISTNITRLLKMGGPASALVAAALDTAFSPGSPELLAIKELHKSVIEGFEKVDNTLQLMEGHILDRFNLADYTTLVSMKLDGMQRLCGRVTNAKFSIRQEYKANFIASCTNIQTEPAQILLGIEKLTTQNCPAPTKESEQIYSQALKQFWKIEANFQPFFNTVLDGFFDYHFVKKRFLAKLFHVDNSTANLLLHEIQTDVEVLFSRNETAPASLMEFTRAIQNIFDAHPHPDSQCILLTALIANEDKTSSARLISQMIATDVVKILDIASYCANASFGGRAEPMMEYLEEAASKAKAILEFTGNWVSKKLDYQWPSTQMAYALKTIKEEYVPAENYNQTAEAIAQKLLKRGLPHYHYHALVSANWVEEKWYYGPICYDSNCNGTLDYHGINIATFRQPIKSRALAQSAKNWTEKWASNITEIISREITIFSLRALAQIIDGAIDGILQEKAYHGYVFVRNMKYREKDCVINEGIFTQPALTEPGHSMIEYFINPGIGEDTQRFNLFLFI